MRELHSESLRREINEGLNVVEHWNGAKGFIFSGDSCNLQLVTLAISEGNSQ
jgi:TnpA family transposase